MAQFTYDPFPAGKTVYQDKKISEDRFHSWTKDNHFRTSYGSMYTDVIHFTISHISLILLRNLKSQQIMLFLATLVSSQGTNPKASSEEAMLPSQKRVLVNQNSEPTSLVSVLLGTSALLLPLTHAFSIALT